MTGGGFERRLPVALPVGASTDPAFRLVGHVWGPFIGGNVDPPAVSGGSS